MDHYARVRRFLRDRGYSAPTLSQLSRNITGKVHRQDAALFFKLSDIPDRSFSVYTEVLWNYVVGTRQAERDQSLRVPTVHDIGTFDGGRFWFVADYFDGPFLSQLLRDDARTAGAWIEKVVAGLSELASVETAFRWTPSDEWRLRHVDEVIDVHAWMLRRTDYYLDRLQSCTFSLQPLVKILETGQVHLTHSLEHGNFVPRHLIALPDGRVAAVDAEFGGRFFPQHYDAAYFYQSVYATLGLAELARLFLRRYRDAAAEYQSHDAFDDQFRVVLAQRTIGGLSDASRLSKDHLPAYYMLVRDIERGSLF